MAALATAEYFRTLAEFLRRDLTSKDPVRRRGAIQRIRRTIPRTQDIADDQIAESLRHGDALLVIAREQGFGDWNSFEKATKSGEYGVLVKTNSDERVKQLEEALTRLVQQVVAMSEDEMQFEDGWLCDRFGTQVETLESVLSGYGERVGMKITGTIDPEEEDHCSECGEELDEEGWDGLCGNCADRKEKEMEEAHSDADLEALSKVRDAYDARVVALLNRHVEVLEQRGCFVLARAAKNHSDLYRWCAELRSPDGRDIYLELEMPDAAFIEGGRVSEMTFWLKASGPGGNYLATVEPFNFTPQCWVDARDVKAVEKRWQEIEGVDPQEFASSILSRL